MKQIRLFLLLIVTAGTGIGVACSGSSCTVDGFFERVVAADLKQVNRCIDSGTDINTINNEGKTALILASEQGNKEMVDFLLQQGANTFIVDNTENYASRAAFQAGHKDISDTIRAFQYKGWKTVRVRFTDTLFQLALQFDVDEVVQEFINEGYSLVEEGENQIPPLPQAIFSGSVHVVELLLDHSVDPDTEFDTRPALMMSALFNELEIARLLIDAGADVSIFDEAGTTALILAAEYGYLEMVQLLLSAGANKDWKDLAGETALDKAKRLKHSGVVELLSK